MSGRLLAAPLLVAVVVLVQAPPPRAILYGLALVSLVLPHAPLWSGAGYRVNEDPATLIDRHGIADERGFYYRGTGLLRARLDRPNPTFPWADEGRRLHQQAPRVVAVDVIGMIGYFAGPQVMIVDRYALADALLARLPPAPVEQWRIGHFKRNLPCGYLETLESGMNVIQNRQVAMYYDKLTLITRGELSNPQRWIEIWKMNTGQYRGLLETYQPTEACTP